MRKKKAREERRITEEIRQKKNKKDKRSKNKEYGMRERKNGI